MAKFTKEAVVEKIKNILKTTGGGQEISDRTINDATENLMVFANEEVELDAFVAQIQGGLISMNGNMRKEKADAAKVIADAEAEKVRLPGHSASDRGIRSGLWICQTRTHRHT